MVNQNRQALSGMMAAILLIGITAGIGGVVYTTMGDQVTNIMSSDTIELKTINIKNTDTASHITAVVKNNGNSDLTNLEVRIDVDGAGDIFTQAFTPADLKSGVTSSLSGKIVDGAGADVYFTTGQKVIVEVRADTPNGGIVSQVVTLKPS